MHGDSSESDAPVVELNVCSCRSSVAARTVFTFSSKNWRNVSASLDVGVIMPEVRLLRSSSVVNDLHSLIYACILCKCGIIPIAYIYISVNRVQFMSGAIL